MGMDAIKRSRRAKAVAPAKRIGILDHTLMPEIKWEL
jgi:hypothetical protein